VPYFDESNSTVAQPVEVLKQFDNRRTQQEIVFLQLRSWTALYADLNLSGDSHRVENRLAGADFEILNSAKVVPLNQFQQLPASRTKCFPCGKVAHRAP
jgi:hypothetical protein